MNNSPLRSISTDDENGDISEIETLSASKRKRIDAQDHEEPIIQQTMLEKEHRFRLEILKNELERAEVKKKAAYNELKSSEINRRLIETKVEEYYR